MSKTKKIPDGLIRDSKGKELKIGSVVRSVAGRDKKRVFVVMAIDESEKEDRVVIANGSLRKLTDAKHKNPMHLLLIGNLGDNDISELKKCPTDDEIDRICKKFDNCLKNEQSSEKTLDKTQSSAL